LRKNNIKKIVVLSLSALIFTACSGASQTAVNSNAAVPPPATTTQKNNNSLVVSSHSIDKTAPSSSSNSANSAPNSSSSNSPMSKPVDVTEMTAKIEKADKELKAKPTDAKTKENLAAAYFERAFALTEAAQYRAALGDFRKGLKLNPNNKEAKDMHDQIIDIFKSIGREPPKEGEEPPPLPIK
jgi:tetratricopeptide (TPR) repeat protein